MLRLPDLNAEGRRAYFRSAPPTLCTPTTLHGVWYISFAESSGIHPIIVLTRMVISLYIEIGEKSVEYKTGEPAMISLERQNALSTAGASGLPGSVSDLFARL